MLKIIFKIIIAILLISIGFCWLCYFGYSVRKSCSVNFLYCSTTAIPAAFMLIGFMLIYSCSTGSKFISVISNKYASRSKLFRIFIDIIPGTLLALGFFFIILFLSPPLPFFDPRCSTGWNDFSILYIVCIPLGLRLFLIQDKTTEINKTSRSQQSPPIAEK